MVVAIKVLVAVVFIVVNDAIQLALHASSFSLLHCFRVYDRFFFLFFLLFELFDLPAITFHWFAISHADVWIRREQGEMALVLIALT